MQFTYHQNSGEDILKIEGELHKYLFKVRRHNKEKELFFRNLNDNNLYQYEVIDIGKRDSSLKLISSEEKIVEANKKLHIGWCKIDFKSIEKMIASLNEMGVDKITFIECEYSQRNDKINYDKLQRLLINSSQQCGRSSIIKIDTCESFDKFIDAYPDSYMFNFSQNHINNKKDDIKTIIIGCEGGFSTSEVEGFSQEKIVGIDSNLILRSESAASVVASKILL
jgi:16S rRNA (uracil1498-N3)-methyltransferase